MDGDVRHRRIVVERFGGPEELRLVPAVIGPPGPGSARVRVLAAGVGATDVTARRGEYLLQRRRPFTPGYEIVGEVVDVGTAVGVAGVVPGTLVAACLPRMGGYSECLALPVSALVPVPDGLDPVTAAAVPLDYLTAASLLGTHARVRAGDAVVVQGATGGVGDALCQLGSRSGLALYGTASPRTLGRLGRSGVTAVDHTSGTLESVVRRGHPAGVRAVFDHLGGESLRAGRRLLAPGGVLVSYAFAGRPGHVLGDTLRGAALNRVLGVAGLLPGGRRTAICSVPRQIVADPSWYRRTLARLLAWTAEGVVRPVVGETFPLADAAAAHRLLQERRHTGKVVLTTT